MICSNCVDLNAINKLIALKVLNSFGNFPLNLNLKYPIPYLTSPLDYPKDISNSKCSKLNSSFYSSVSLLWKKQSAYPVYPISAKGFFILTSTRGKNLSTILESSFLLHSTSNPLETSLNPCFESYLICEYVSFIYHKRPGHHHVLPKLFENFLIGLSSSLFHPLHPPSIMYPEARMSLFQCKPDYVHSQIKFLNGF